MAQGRFSRRLTGMPERDEAAPEGAPLGGTKAEATQRLQIGLFGLGSMVLLVGLASIIGSQADLAEEASVPDAAPTTEPTEAPAQTDPLADAGIVPDIPAEPEEPAQESEVADLPLPAGEGPQANDTADLPDDLEGDAGAQ